MPTINSYKNDPGYYIRAWTSELGNINYQLKPQGWDIINDWDSLPTDGSISWQQINALKSVGVVYTDDTGVIHPDDEKFQPDPDQIDSTDLTSEEVESFLDAIRTNCSLSSEQISALYQIFGIQPPETEVDEQFEGAVKSLKADLKADISAGNIPVNETLPLTRAQKFFRVDPDDGTTKRDDVEVVCFVLEAEDVEERGVEFEETEEMNTVAVTIVSPGTGEEQHRDFVMHFIFFNDTEIAAWSALSSQELTWEIRSELFGQISTILPPTVDALTDSGTTISEKPSDFDISFTHEDLKLIEQ
ncbi:hypothetical protein [Halorubrum laminariae]|uniref:Uncharacterized protein n=1 Tax=Halorubrum laminariae TaxID=1433523 RepID=A0ABD6C0L5_9EURY|nr:hypothetical protein [Halorubrum laminariae]